MPAKQDGIGGSGGELTCLLFSFPHFMLVRWFGVYIWFVFLRGRMHGCVFDDAAAAAVAAEVPYLPHFSLCCRYAESHPTFTRGLLIDGKIIWGGFFGW